MTTVREALTQAIQALDPAGQGSARLDAQVLLSHVLDLDRALLYAYPERELTPEQERQFHSLVERRSHAEPVAYLLGWKEFYGLDLFVDRRVLIPRPETELLVQMALKVLKRMYAEGRTPVVADIGTGSGAIPIALAVQESRLPYLYASDISTEALEVARLNCERHHVETRVRLLHGDLVAALPEPVDLLTANLPYVGTNELENLPPDVRDFEPHGALFSGPQGLDLLHRLFLDAERLAILKKGAVLVLEIGYQQREPLTRMIHAIWPRAIITFEQDYSGWDRLLMIAL